MKTSLPLLLLALAPLNSQAMSSLFSRPASSNEKTLLMSHPDQQHQRNLFLGNIFKQGLEGLHFNKRTLNNQLSVTAFNEYIKLLDFGKRFLTTTDITQLRKYEEKIDDQIVSGSFTIIDQAENLLTKRTKQIQAYVKKRLKQPFNLETLSTLNSTPKSASGPPTKNNSTKCGIKS